MESERLGMKEKRKISKKMMQPYQKAGKKGKSRYFHLVRFVKLLSSTIIQNLYKQNTYLITFHFFKSFFVQHH
jgi:hypothetical protein